MKYIEIGSANIAYRTYGSGKINLVIMHGLNSCSAEWWQIAKKLSDRFTVLVYDRPGYGSSASSKAERCPMNIAIELKQLLDKLCSEKKIILIGHSQGGLYAQQFARLYPDMVKGIILLDPLSANDNEFHKSFTLEECKKSGIDKLGTLKTAKLLTRIGLGFVLKPLFRKAPPFYYYKGFSKEAEGYLLNALTKSKQYETAINEYESAHVEENIRHLKSSDGFPDIPLILITHGSKFSIEESVYYGSPKELACAVEDKWLGLMSEYLDFSSKSKHVVAQNSSHFMHLTEFELLENELNAFI